MKILAVTPYYYPKIGGLENYARQLNIALQQQGWEVAVATSNHTGRAASVDTVDGMTVYRLGAWLKFSNTPLNPLWPLSIRRIIRKEQPDLIIAHSPVPSMADAAALAAGKTPFVLVYHAATLFKNHAPLFNSIAFCYRLYQQLTMRRAKRIVAVSGYVKEQLARSLQRKTVVIPNAVWRAEATGRKAPPKDANFLFIGSLDRTHVWKGLDLILEALAIYRGKYDADGRLTVAGDGDYRAHYEQHAAQLGLADHVRFAGAQIGKPKDTLIATATALVTYPTTANDAFPTVILEAWAKGVPVASASIGALPSIINDRIDGYLAPAHQPTALADTLHQIMTDGPTKRQKIAAAGLRRTIDDYTWEQQAQRFTTLAKELYL